MVLDTRTELLPQLRLFGLELLIENKGLVLIARSHQLRHVHRVHRPRRVQFPAASALGGICSFLADDGETVWSALVAHVVHFFGELDFVFLHGNELEEIFGVWDLVGEFG